jgi:hypothetical protein
MRIDPDEFFNVLSRYIEEVAKDKIRDKFNENHGYSNYGTRDNLHESERELKAMIENMMR